MVGDNALIGKHADLALKLANIPTVFSRRLLVIPPPPYAHEMKSRIIGLMAAIRKFAAALRK